MEWNTYEHRQEKKTADWYLAAGVIVAAIAITAAIFDNILFALIIVVGFITLLILGSKEPKSIHVKIRDIGIVINKYLYTFDSLESFNIDEHRDVLILKSKKTFSTHIIFPIPEEVSLPELRELLKKHVKEETDMRESVFEQFMEYLGF